MAKNIVAALAVSVLLGTTSALAQLEDFTSREASAALRAALEKGSQAAVARLGRADGFLGNPQVRIPLPDSMQRVERTMRRFGFGAQADELIVTMNRAAEAAVPEARPLFLGAIRNMTLRDAKEILQGGETAGTEYFRRSTQAQLHARFLPIVQRATAKVGVARYYNDFAARSAAFGLIRKEDANLDEYITQKTLDGLFFMVGEEEKSIRRDPVRAGTDLVRKVFGALAR